MQILFLEQPEYETQPPEPWVVQGGAGGAHPWRGPAPEGWVLKTGGQGTHCGGPENAEPPAQPPAPSALQMNPSLFSPGPAQPAAKHQMVSGAQP